MPVSVSIEPFSANIDLYDSPDAHSAYSLSGHIVISLTPSSSLLGRPAPQNLLLTSLELTFEGQSELVLTDIGYAPLRLISLKKELVSEPVAIAAPDEDDHAEWRVVFDLPVPGWLPSSAVFGDDDDGSAGVSYALYARARFLNVEDAPAPSVWNNLCAAVRPNRPRSVHAEAFPITLTRFVSPPPGDGEFSRSAYSIQAVPDGVTTNIPADLLRTLEMHVIVPTRNSLSDESIPLVLRMRAPPRDSPLRVLGFEADVVQVENYFSSPPSSYSSRFPLPCPAQQPPQKPLTAPHPVGALYALGLIGGPAPDTRIIRENSLVPPTANKLFRIRGADTVAHAPGVPLEDTWLRMAASIPIAPHARPREESPLLDVRHELRIRLSVGLEDGADGAATSDELVFGVPLQLVRVGTGAGELYQAAALSTASLPLPHPAMSSRAPSRARSLGSLVSRASTPAPPPALPAYSQLFHENGDRKDSAALPLYREKDEGESENDSSASTSESPRSPLTPPDSPLTPNTPLSPPGLPKRRTPPKFGESFLPFDEEEDDADDEEEEEVQYGIAL